MATFSIRQIVQGRELASVQLGITVREACHVMNRLNVGAVAVLKGDALAGILSEREVIRKCIGQNRLTSETLVDDIMTSDPVTINIDQSLADGLVLMADGHFRHLPVVEDSRTAAMLSMRDIPIVNRLMYERYIEYRNSVSFA